MKLPFFLDFILHIDVYLLNIITANPKSVYALLFAIIFLETGLVIMPFLPGDSLIFAAGSFAAIGSLNIFILWIILLLAAIIGDSVNYSIGSLIGKKAFGNGNSLFFNRTHLARTQIFYEKHGGKTIVLARFVPIVRTFAPFVAGIGKMRYSTFFAYNALGGLIWVSLFTWGGYLFGRIPAVRDNFTLVIIAIIAISIFPLIIPLLGRGQNSDIPPHLRSRV